MSSRKEKFRLLKGKKLPQPKSEPYWFFVMIAKKDLGRALEALQASNKINSYTKQLFAERLKEQFGVKIAGPKNY